MPETVCFNQQANEDMDLFICFKPIIPQEMQNIHIYCVYQDNNISYNTKPVPVTQWYNEQDTTWFGKLHASHTTITDPNNVDHSLLSRHTLQLYFPFNACITHNNDLDLGDDYIILEENQVFISKDYWTLVYLQDKKTMYIYSIDPFTVISFIQNLPGIKITHTNTADIVKLLGQQQKDILIPLSVALSEEQQ